MVWEESRIGTEDKAGSDKLNVSRIGEERGRERGVGKKRKIYSDSCCKQVDGTACSIEHYLSITPTLELRLCRMRLLQARD